MSRIEFDSQGQPLPSIALPPFGSDTDLPPTMLTFNESADFSVAQYRSLGFTHFEVWCVGAAGGRGGNATSSVDSAVEEIWRPVPQDVWNLHLEQIRIQDYISTGVWDSVYGFKPSEGGGAMTAVQAEEWFNPSHLMMFSTYRQIWPNPQVEAMGGGGGGGGFHKTSGLLADLSDLVPVVVGKAGADSSYGQVYQNGLWTPDLTFIPRPLDPRGYPWSRLDEIVNYFHAYLESHPLPHESFGNPTKGEDGGYSSFADVGKASGGEGGDPGKVWDGTKFVVKGNGGDGGIGGRIISGGGGAGSSLEGTNGSDGVWDPDTGIGAGGGGGKGGLPSESKPGGFGQSPIVTTHLATAGGQGSYSFGDTSVYGQRQFRLPWTYMKAVKGTWLVLEPGVFPFSHLPVSTPKGNGTVTFVSATESANLVTPGGGGGARPTKNLKVGSYATGYSPDGVVVLRLSQIT